MNDFTDPAGLDAVRQRSGPRATQGISLYGPAVLAMMKSIGGPFRIKGLEIIANEWGLSSWPATKHNDLILNTIRYINASDMPIYVQQKRVAKATIWIILDCDMGQKQIMRDVDEEISQRGRIIYPKPIVPKRPSLEIVYPQPHTRIPMNNIEASAYIANEILRGMADRSMSPDTVSSNQVAMMVYHSLQKSGLIGDEHSLPDHEIQRLVFPQIFPKIGAAAEKGQSIELDL